MNAEQQLIKRLETFKDKLQQETFKETTDEYSLGWCASQQNVIYYIEDMLELYSYEIEHEED